MGWSNSHLHCFTIGKRRSGDAVNIGMRVDGELYEDDLDEDDEILSKYTDSFLKKPVVYDYDFGDNWQHKLELKSVHPKESGVVYPRCIKGQMACPPDDCGGIPGYYYFLEAYKDKNHEDHEQAFDVFADGFDPEYFDIKDIDFSCITEYDD
jgi:hypothetical protein